MSGRTADRVLQILIGLLLALLAAAVVASLRERVVSIGDKAPDFSVVTDAGRRISPRDFGGRLLVLNFWATWCPPCIAEIPSLDQFGRRFAKEGVVVLAISVDQDERAYREFLAQRRVSFLTARDPSAAISAAYGTFKYPETYVIDASGRIVQKYIGPRAWDDAATIRGMRALLGRNIF